MFFILLFNLNNAIFNLSIFNAGVEFVTGKRSFLTFLNSFSFKTSEIFGSSISKNIINLGFNSFKCEYNLFLSSRKLKCEVIAPT